MKEKTRPHILITNDDGIHAPGIRHLWEALHPYAELTVVAPLHEQSAVGLSTTLRSPLRIEKGHWGTGIDNIWSVNGTPSDCVKLALNAVLKHKPDLVVSGINRGANMGRSVLYSGTVAAAIESTLQDIPAVAISSHNFLNPDYVLPKKYAHNIISYVLDNPLPMGTLLNVNFPENEDGTLKGFKMTTQGRDWWMEKPDRREHPAELHAYYWLGCQLRLEDGDEGDGTWLRKGYATAVPVRVGDLTDHGHLKHSREAFERKFQEYI